MNSLRTWFNRLSASNNVNKAIFESNMGELCGFSPSSDSATEIVVLTEIFFKVTSHLQRPKKSFFLLLDKI